MLMYIRLFVLKYQVSSYSDPAEALETPNFIELLRGNICSADFVGYQPNVHTKCVYFGW